jgi:long-chain acyl-CoA synthetase
LPPLPTLLKPQTKGDRTEPCSLPNLPTPNLVALFLARADEKGDAPFLRAKRNGTWQSISWKDTAQKVCLLAEGLIKLGLRRGDPVMLVSENRPEWAIADLAIMAAGCVTVPTYITNTERDHTHILENSGACAVIVSGAKLAKPLLPAVLRSGHGRHVIGMEPLGDSGGRSQLSRLGSLLEGDAEAARKAVEARIATIGRADTACIIYTSGTGGAPRGVMQHHGAILHNVAGAARILAEDFGWGDEVFLSFLPLSHAYEHTGGQFLPIGMGGQIAYAEGLEKLAPTSRKSAPPSWWWSPACSRCCAPASSRASRSRAACPTI